jgi:hypothetical protein
MMVVVMLCCIAVWKALSYLTRYGEPVRIVCALDDTSDALDGMHELRELIRAQIHEARDGAR